MCILYRCGIKVQKDDTATVLEMWGDGWLVISFFSIILAIILIVVVAKERPIKRCMIYFDIK